MLFGMQFNEQELHQLRAACIEYQHTSQSSFQIREYDNLISKIDNYKEEYSCDDCDYCEIHGPTYRSVSKRKTSHVQSVEVAPDRSPYLDVVGTAD